MRMGIPSATLAAAIVVGLGVAGGAALAQQGEAPEQLSSEVVGTFAVPEANQGVGVDDRHFYAVDNRTVAKYDKETGELVDRWEGPKDGGIKHLDSAAIVDGKLYVAQANYPEYPMTSSVEVWDAETMEHVDSHSFGIDRGSLTWIDRHDGAWWGAFANYNRVFGRSPIAYGNKYFTQIVRFDDDWRVEEAWVLPEEIIERFEDMSNSGGSWGPDGRLYITGHDAPEAYALEVPEAGSVMNWVATVPLENTGQGIAWDRSEPGVLYGIIRGDTDADNRVTDNRVNLPQPVKGGGDGASQAAPAAGQQQQQQ